MSNNLASKCPIMIQILVQADYTNVRFAFVLSTENLFVIFSEIGPKCYVLAVVPLVCAISRKNEHVCFSGDLVKIFLVTFRLLTLFLISCFLNTISFVFGKSWSFLFELKKTSTTKICELVQILDVGKISPSYSYPHGLEFTYVNNF